MRSGIALRTGLFAGPTPDEARANAGLMRLGLH
jgi:hypothetical protein